MAPNTRAQTKAAEPLHNPSVSDTVRKISDMEREIAKILEEPKQAADEPRPLAGVVGFKDSAGHTSIATDEMEHLRLRCVGLNSLAKKHVTDGIKHQNLAMELNALHHGTGHVAAGQSDLAKVYDQYIAQGEAAQSAYIKRDATLVELDDTLKSYCGAVLGDLPTIILTTLPLELREMLYGFIDDFEYQIDVDNRTEIPDKTFRKHYSGWCLDPAVLGEEMSTEIRDLVRRKSRFEIESDQAVPGFLTEGRWMQSLFDVAVFRKVQIFIPPDDYAEGFVRRTELLKNLNLLHEHQDQKFTVDIELDRCRWRLLGDSGLEEVSDANLPALSLFRLKGHTVTLGNFPRWEDDVPWTG